MKKSTLLALVALLGVSIASTNAFADNDCAVCKAAKNHPNAPVAPKNISLTPTARKTLEANLLPADPALWVKGAPIQQWEPNTLYLLEFWASWCRPCREAIPHIQQLNEAMQGKGFKIIGVNLDHGYTPEKARDFLIRQPIQPSYDLVLGINSGLVQAVQPRGIPHGVIVKNGEIIWAGHPVSLTVDKIKELQNK